MDFREEIMIGSTTASECAAPAATEVTLAPMSRSRPTIRGVSARPRIPRKKRRKEGRRKGRGRKYLFSRRCKTTIQDYYTALYITSTPINCVHHYTPLYTTKDH